MRARNGLTGRGEVSEVIGLSPELKVAGPSMLGIGCPYRHALPHITPDENTLTMNCAPLPRERVRSPAHLTRSRGASEGFLTEPQRPLGHGTGHHADPHVLRLCRCSHLSGSFENDRSVAYVASSEIFGFGGLM